MMDNKEIIKKIITPPRIITIEKLMKRKEKLDIPSYQRPYKWSVESISQLFFDIKDTMIKKKEGKLDEYRLGSIILCKKNDNSDIYEIVDGQQRYISILLLLKCLDKSYPFPSLERINYAPNSISHRAIHKNYLRFSLLINTLENDIQCFKKTLLENCTLVEIIVNDQALAFQMFDSQNYRGKPLYPHDLLKAYHLRVMKENYENYSDMDENSIIYKDIKEMVDKWEKIDIEKKQDIKLNDLIGTYLFQIRNWIKKERNDDFTVEKIGEFKGINPKNKYPFATYHIDAGKPQLEQPIIAGKLFFEYINHYYDVLIKIRNKIDEKYKIPNTGERLKNARHLFERIVLLFCDRFTINELNDKMLNLLFFWSYCPYYYFEAPTFLTYYKFAIGENDEVPNYRPLFNEICSFSAPDDLFKLDFVKAKLKYKDRQISKIKKSISDYFPKEYRDDQ